ncbi:MAG: TetR/AcrR family transcriptional regulator [Actinomycetota bacterium]
MTVAQGRRPVQQRGIEKRNSILDAAAHQLRRRGLPINLTAVAEMAEVPIGSVYQYFPSHAALIVGLAERHLRTVGGEIVNQLVDGDTVADAPDAIESALRAYLAVADDPLQVAIMRAIRADDALRAIDRNDTQANARRLATKLAAGGVAVSATRLGLVIDLAGETILLLADRDPTQRAELADEFIALVTR